MALYLFLFKILTLSTGVFTIWLGYKLFVKGIFNQSSDLNVSLGNKKLLLKKAAPGIFFTLFGAVIICFAVFKGLSFELITSGISATIKEEKHHPLLLDNP